MYTVHSGYSVLHILQYYSSAVRTPMWIVMRGQPLYDSGIRTALSLYSVAAAASSVGSNIVLSVYASERPQHQHTQYILAICMCTHYMYTCTHYIHECVCLCYAVYWL
jgi:hypothetical protein